MEVNDLISRQAAINECNKRGAEHIGYAISKLPSAQLTQTNTDSTQGCISRQAAIYAVSELVSSMSVCISVDECDGMKRMQGMAVRALNNLPSAQPDFDITVKIDKAYDDGYEAGYLQGRHDWGDLDE